MVIFTINVYLLEQAVILFLGISLIVTHNDQWQNVGSRVSKIITQILCKNVMFSDEVDSCSPDPCKNGGTCSEDAGGQASCSCPSGFTGSTCGNQLQS